MPNPVCTQQAARWLNHGPLRPSGGPARESVAPPAKHYKTPPAANQFVNMIPTNTESNDDRELRLALERADKTSILFRANLVEAGIANRVPWHIT